MPVGLKRLELKIEVNLYKKCPVKDFYGAFFCKVQRFKEFLSSHHKYKFIDKHTVV